MLTDDNALHAALRDGLEQMDLPVPDDAARQLIRYIALLAKWNKTHNLTAIRNPADMVRRHLLDSLSLYLYVDGENLLDVGAGAGLPGIPLAIVKPHLNVTLLDSVLKKTHFMTFAANDLGLSNVTVKHQRVERMQHDEGFQMVVARAFSSVDKLCSLTDHLLRPGGRILAMIGQPLSDQQTQELSESCGFAISLCEKLFVPGEHAMRNIVVLERIADR